MNQQVAALYKHLSAQFTMADCTSDYGSLVVPTGNDTMPVHRWFRFKEAYSHQLLSRLFKDAEFSVSGDQGGFSLFDPFSGSGTSLVSAIGLAAEAGCSLKGLGIERNPFLEIVSSAKITASLHGATMAERLERELPSCLRDYKRLMQGWRSLSTPSVTLSNPRYFSPHSKRALLALGIAASNIVDEDVRRFYQLAVGAAVEPSGKLRKDGRALRYVADKVPSDPPGLFQSNIKRFAEDLRSSRTPVDARVSLMSGDARSFTTKAMLSTFDWCVFSPPYPNNIDYTEVYKLEAWALGLYDDVASLREQRLSTLRSHPSVTFQDSYESETGVWRERVLALSAPLLGALPDDRYKRGREQVVRGYIDDLVSVFSRVREVLVPGGEVACVVGNSVHGTGPSQFVIASDLLVAGVADLVGLDVSEIRVARHLRRRGEGIEHLRESVVVARKPVSSGSPSAVILDQEASRGACE